MTALNLITQPPVDGGPDHAMSKIPREPEEGVVSSAGTMHTVEKCGFVGFLFFGRDIKRQFGRSPKFKDAFQYFPSSLF